MTQSGDMKAAGQNFPHYRGDSTSSSRCETIALVRFMTAYVFGSHLITLENSSGAVGM